MNTKSGFIALLGRPNVGKSSLMNALIGEKVAIVSPKPQTTRDRIMGIYSDEANQMVFVDTPGYHAPKTKLGDYMQRAAAKASDDVDVIVVVLDVTKPFTDTDRQLIRRQLAYQVPLYIAVNKVDLCGYEKTYPYLSRISAFAAELEKEAVKEILPVSAKKRVNVEKLKEYLLSALQPGEFFFPADELSDKSERYIICEIIREKALLYLQDEVPHGIGVALQAMEVTGKLAKIEADIVCEKETHKQIIIGESGSMLKTIGERARTDIEAMLQKKVFLHLYVKVREDWRNRKDYMADIGYDSKQ